MLPLAQHDVLLPLLDNPQEVPKSLHLLPLALLEPAVDRQVLIEFVPGGQRISKIIFLQLVVYYRR